MDDYFYPRTADSIQSETLMVYCRQEYTVNCIGGTETNPQNRLLWVCLGHRDFEGLN